MTDIDPAYHTHYRRAAAYLAQYAADDGEGISAVLDEAEAAGGLRELVLTIPALVFRMQPEWDTPRTAQQLRRMAAIFAGREHGEPASTGRDKQKGAADE